ncbi:MAG: DUF5114 domain-containing protein [Dysgonamonadaceae bacterium]|jgi:hypothetical protein|nr:DUF5114 domain-containing protein [Dysgonamonadaceae bacterium]
MKINKIKRYLGLLLSLVLVTSCEEDGERLYLYGLEANQLMATSNAVVLSQENAGTILLQLTWNKSALTLSDPNLAAPDVLISSIQISTNEDFSSNVFEYAESNLSRSYTGAELNTIAKNLGLTPDVATPVYFRISSKTGNNMQPVFSNVVNVGITPFTIDMSLGFILDSNKNGTGRTLSSPESNGIYAGFMGASGWYNYFLKEGDETIWGNSPVDGSDFTISSASDAWNMWFPSQSGCYYTIVNTVEKKWSALWLPTLTVSGDITGEMTFDRANVKWTYTFTATETGAKTIKLNTTGKQYNATTKTDDAAAVDTPIAFVQDGGKIVLAQTAGNLSVSIPEKGDMTLTLDLSNPDEWKCEIVKGSAGPVEINPYLYMPGIDDGISGSWTFDNYLTLYNEDNLAYAGVINVYSLWGYSFNTEKDNWDDKYTFGEGDAYNGTLVAKGPTNIPAPAPGLYLIDVSLKNMTYSLVGVGEEIYVAGLNDDWGFIPLAKTAAGVFSGTVTITKASEWGFQIHTDQTWNHKFGGSEGKLYYQGNNLTDDASLMPGAYKLTIDLIHSTYSITQ